MLHGERHDEALSGRRVLDHLRAAGRTAREGEFLALTYEEARQRIDRGLATLLSCGLSPIGFVPPAWLSRACTRDAARDAGMILSEDERCVYLLQQGVALDAPVLRWSARSMWRARASTVVTDVRWQVQRYVPAIRIALHPADMDDPRLRASLQRALERWLGERPATSYGTLAMGSSFEPRAA